MTKPTPKLILLTGATRGLGRAMTDRFAELGHTVVGCGRDAAQIAEEFDRYKELLALYDLLREPDRSKAE